MKEYPKRFDVFEDGGTCECGHHQSSHHASFFSFMFRSLSNPKYRNGDCMDCMCNRYKEEKN